MDQAFQNMFSREAEQIHCGDYYFSIPDIPGFDNAYTLEQEAVDAKVEVYFKEKNPDRGKVLVDSGVSALRTAILDAAKTLTRIPPFSPIHFLDRALSLLDGELRSIMKV